MINTSLEKVVELTLDCASSIGLDDGQLDEFELELRRALMKEFCSTTPTFPPTTSGTYITSKVPYTNSGTKELLRG